MFKIIKRPLYGKSISNSKKKTLRVFNVNNHIKKFDFKFNIIKILSYKKFLKEINLYYEKEK